MKILLGMSGGLDSTYSLRILQDQGYTVEGAVLVMHRYTDTEAAKKAAENAGIPIHIIDCTELFDHEVADNFAKEYSRGRTPNPCTVCNRFVKFEMLRRFAKENGFDKIATGHYASVKQSEGRFFITRPLDERKDQSYMLWSLTQEQLSMLVLPLAELKKEKIREEARGLGIESADRPESQDICFLPNGGYAEFVESRVGASREGNFVTPDGKVLGRHRGIVHYTVGQRRGLGISLGERMFVSGIDHKNNTVTLVPSGTVSDRAYVTGLNFQKLSEQSEGVEKELQVKIRYAAPPAKCKVRFLAGDRAEIYFYTPVSSVTPGQSAVFYDGEGDLVFGGVFE